MPIKPRKPTIASCVLTILLVSQLRGSVWPGPVRLRIRHVESAY